MKEIFEHEKLVIVKNKYKILVKKKEKEAELLRVLRDSEKRVLALITDSFVVLVKTEKIYEKMLKALEKNNVEIEEANACEKFIISRMLESYDTNAFRKALVSKVKKVECWVLTDELHCGLGYPGRGEAIFRIIREPQCEFDVFTESYVYELVESSYEDYLVTHYEIPYELVRHIDLSKYKHKVFSTEKQEFVEEKQ